MIVQNKDSKGLIHTYSDGIFNKRIVIIGPLPPPLGGISVHIDRVMVKLGKQANHVMHFEGEPRYRYKLFFIYMFYLFYFLIKNKPNEIHVHTLFLANGLQELRWIIRLKKLLKFELILVEHDCRYLYRRTLSWKKQLNKCMPMIRQQVLIGSITAQSFKENQIAAAQKKSIESAFLSPDETKETIILTTYPDDLFHFINRYKWILLGNAFALRLIGEKDLYGFDQSLQALHALRKKGHDVGLVFVLGSIGDNNYFSCCMRTIAQLGLNDYVYILTGQKELWPLIKKVDVFIRPTLSDGASVSIEEALWCKKTVVASDVCWRPKAVFLYKTGDTDDLILALSHVLHVGSTKSLQQLLEHKA